MNLSCSPRQTPLHFPLLLISLMLFLPSLHAASTPVTIAHAAPAAQLSLLSGETLDLSKFRGNKPVYLKFWATWCQPCRKEMPHLQHTFEQYGQKMQVVAINLGFNDTLSQIKAFRKQYGLSVPIAIDSSGDLVQSFGVIGTPFHVLINKQGDIVHTSFKADEKLDAMIKKLAGQ